MVEGVEGVEREERGGIQTPLEREGLSAERRITDHRVWTMEIGDNVQGLKTFTGYSADAVHYEVEP